MLKFILNLVSSLFRQTKIDIAKYPARRIDYGTLNDKQRNAFDSIMAACESGKDTADIPQLTQAEFDGVIAHIGLHFGSADICKNIALKRGNTAAINLELYAQAIAHKAELDARVDKALATMTEGTAEHKLKQICRWIADNVRYKNGTNDPLDLLNKGGMCGAYSMLFYKMATRLDIKAYICYGEADNGLYKGFHAWNMVELDGKAYFYDVTFFDSVTRNSKYLHSVDGWGRECALNAQK